MTVLMSNTFTYDKETGKAEYARTGFIGAFDSREKAMDAWNDALKECGVPEDRIHEFAPGRLFGDRCFWVDRNGKLVNEIKYAEFVIQLMSKDTEMNKVWTNEMAEA